MDLKVLLVIVFSINGEPTIIEDGYSPLLVDESVCEERRQHAIDYLSTLSNIPEVFGVYCGTQEEIQEQLNIDLLSTPV